MTLSSTDARASEPGRTASGRSIGQARDDTHRPPQDANNGHGDEWQPLRHGSAPDAAHGFEALVRKYDGASAGDLLSGFIGQEFAGRIAVASSFGAESAALLAMVARVDRRTPILFLQTKVLFDETLAYAEELCSRLGLVNLQLVEPDTALLESEDPQNSLWISNPDRCCFIRKVQPFRRALSPYDCWISGLKRTHGGVRLFVEPIELEDGRIKLNPLFDKTPEDIARVFEKCGLPQHPLTKIGFRSIGCIPCTRIAGTGETAREGRWPREAKTECGIHSLLYARARQESGTKEAERHRSAHRRNWFVTGACGTVGRELLCQLQNFDPLRVVAIDNNESELFFLNEDYRRDGRFSFYVCDLRDRADVAKRMAGAEIVLHAAALKHVVLCEQSPASAIQTNIIGTQSIIDAAHLNGVERILFTSSDKAVNPTNVMGTSKLMAERLISAANAFTRKGKQVFASTRFGNVLGSRGSVVPIFRRQIAAGGPVTLTDEHMTRFIMTLSQAVKLVTESVFLAKGGEVFVTKMPVVRILDLARAMIEELAPGHGYRPSDIPIEIIGTKAGEKLYEELMNEEEVRRSIELADYFVIAPALRSINREIDYVYPGMQSNAKPQAPYNSSTAGPMSYDEVRQYLHAHTGLLKTAGH